MCDLRTTIARRHSKDVLSAQTGRCYLTVVLTIQTSSLTLLHPRFISVRKQSYRLKLVDFPPVTSPSQQTIKMCSMKRKMAVLNGDASSLRMLNTECRSKAKLAKLEYKLE